MADYIDRDAELASDDESDQGSEVEDRPRKSNGGTRNIDNDSSEEETDDEEAERAVREGFIVDDEDEDDAGIRRKSRKKKRIREDEEELLDDDDLEIIGLRPDEAEDGGQPRFKRLKQGHRGTTDIFSDEDDEGPVAADDMGDFIEDDYSDDEVRRQRDELEVGRPGKRGHFDIQALTEGLDEASLEDYRAAFGDGKDYEWALALEEEAEIAEDEEQDIELKDVFEPGQLSDKLLTDDDVRIRETDIPERMQIDRQHLPPFDQERFESYVKAEVDWIGNLILPKKQLDPTDEIAYKYCIENVLKYLNEQDYEVPFIYQQRKDYILDPETQEPLLQPDLWEIYESDLKYQGLLEKRSMVTKIYTTLQEHANITDRVFTELISNTVTNEEVQDIQEYLNFTYSAELRDIQPATESNGTHKRPRTKNNDWERIRSGRVQTFVNGIGISADDFASNALNIGRVYTDDPNDRPDDLADSLLDPPEFTNGNSVLKAGKAMFVEQLIMNPRMRKYMRETYYKEAAIDCIRTEKGLVEITEDHPYYEFKYFRNMQFHSLMRRPDLLLRMIKAEDEGLVSIRFIIQAPSFREKLYRLIISDGISEIAEAWNILRRELVDMAIDRLEKQISKGVKDALRTECENGLAKICRERFYQKLYQGQYQKPRDSSKKDRDDDLNDEDLTILAISNGHGVAGRDAVCWVFMDENGKVNGHGKFNEIRAPNEDGKGPPRGADNSKYLQLLDSKAPLVIAIAGFSPETQKLAKDIELIMEERLREEREERLKQGKPALETPNDKYNFRKPDIVLVDDATSRLYYKSEKASTEFPEFAPVQRYCVGLARYLQNPLYEYAAIMKNITSISFDPNQNLVPKDKLIRHLETSVIDAVNQVGVNLDEVLAGNRVQQSLLPYVAGLGNRKAAQVLEALKKNQFLASRGDLVGDPERNIVPAMNAKVWDNAVSFLYLESAEDDDTETDFLDNTRIHPEDYDLARKIAADALNLDEEDIIDEVGKGGPSAVVVKLANSEEGLDGLKALYLPGYAEELANKFKQRKRKILEVIVREIPDPYGDHRAPYKPLDKDEVFSMLTGETKETLAEGMIVPVKVKRVFANHIDIRLDCGIDGSIPNHFYPRAVGGEHGEDPRNVYSSGQTVQAKIKSLHTQTFTAELSLSEEDLRIPYVRSQGKIADWDRDQEDADKRKAQKEKETKAGRAQRVIKHPLFKPFNATQAEQFLGSQNPGDLVIRPSSRGPEHLAVTWKVADNVYQHIDVLELDKPTEFDVGRILKIANKYTYSDLDDLIENHVKAMARKVNEMVNDEKFRKDSKEATEKWLDTYTIANPKRSNYQFCINSRYPGYFHLIFKAGLEAKLGSWPVKVVPNAFELLKNQYPDMRALKNGFKILVQSGRL